MEVVIYHLITRGIEGKILFPEEEYYRHFLSLMDFYRRDVPVRFSHFIRLSKDLQEEIMKSSPEIVSLIAYCLMPNHIHIVAESSEDNMIVRFTRRLFDSYTRYFNARNKRKGTLYQHSIRKILVEREEYLLHLTRYVHLNPCSAGLVQSPEEWPYSSYREFIGAEPCKICDFHKYLSIDGETYKDFVEDRKDYQRSLELLKKHLKELGLY